MEKNNLIMGVIGIMICVILVGGLLIPAVNTAALISGEPVSFTNTNNTVSPYNYDYVDSLNVEFIVNDDNTWSGTINGIVINSYDDNVPLFYSDGGFCELFPTSNDSVAGIELWDVGGESTYWVGKSSAGTVTIIFEDGTATLTKKDGEVVSFPYTWVCAIHENGRFIPHNGPLSNVYISSLKDVLIYSGNYTTGENDTRYAYANGVCYAQGDYADQMSVTYQGGHLVDGTLDIYTGGTAPVVIGDETFTPYRCLILKEIDGTASGSAVQNMLYVLPVVVIVSIVLAGIYIFIGRKY